MLKLEQKIQQLWSQAGKSRQELDMATAVTCYQQISQLQPQQTDVYCELGNLYFEQQQPQQAINAYQQAIAINPRQPPWVYQTLGKVLQEQQDIAPAITAYQRAIQLDDQPPSWIYRNLGDLLVKQGKYQQAIAIYQQLTALDSAFAAEAQFKIGNIYHQQQQFFPAQAAYRQATMARAFYNIDKVIRFIRKYLRCSQDQTQIDILDNGCDPTGRQLALLAEATSGRVVGTNILPGFPQHTVKRRRPNNEFYAMDGQELSFAADSFDLVISLNVLEHVPNPSRYLYQCWRVMRPGGYGFFSWYPVWSGATGHHIHPDMVNRQAQNLGIKPPRYSLDGTSIPFWGHLLYSPQEMLEFLLDQQQYAPNLAEWMRDYIYYGQDLNRWLWRDVWRSFQALNWKIIESNHHGEQSLPSDILQQLTRKYGVVDNFQICGATIIVQKMSNK
ncbi:MAG: tetratricopeptide repeat protein [Cyanobacteria bacterium J06642_3]